MLNAPVSTATSYDRVPYKSHPFRQSHPDRLAVIATLHGMSPPPIERARVLELGCASGGNLLPIADQFPEGTFLGLDLSSRQIQDGQRLIERAGLKNVELRHQDILTFDAPPESFDYILCHGVFSWVPDAVQRKILDICGKCLSPNGVAYVSYNTYPGWHMRGMIRDIMRYRAQFFDKPEQQLNQARGLLTFLSESVKTENNAYGILLKNELEAISGADDSYLMHDHLEEINNPIYFHEFAERANSSGLQYLGEADFGSMSLENFPDPIRSEPCCKACRATSSSGNSTWTSSATACFAKRYCAGRTWCSIVLPNHNSCSGWRSHPPPSQKARLRSLAEDSIARSLRTASEIQPIGFDVLGRRKF